jgi:ribonuclease BN (tRNA processing enzyme)/energy-coupling factor transporter ATP-binding protein EcfA2
MTTTRTADHFPLLQADAAEIVSAVLAKERRVLLCGAPGVGKSTLVSILAAELAQQGQECWCLGADPGSPLMGVPGAVSLGRWVEGDWQVGSVAALCTLDAGRFRLPLVSVVRQLMQSPIEGTLLIDGPGVVRGVAGGELLAGLVGEVQPDTILLMVREDESPPLLNELKGLEAEGIEVYQIVAAEQAARPSKRARARQRTAQWERYLASAAYHELELDSFNLTGTPPPREAAHAWTGRQVALLAGQRTVALGEVERLQGNRLSLRVPAAAGTIDTLLLRDATRSADGLLETADLWTPERLAYLPPVDLLPAVEVSGGPRLVGRVGPADVALINGVFGDPLLHVRLRHQRRSLLFDLGGGERLSARVAHQVSDVFITHAHLDHIGGFLWLLRSRIGEFPPCRLYGPPGLAAHIAGFLQGALWDRVAIHGPRFEVVEFDGEQLRSYRLQATRPQPELFEEREVEAGVIVEEVGYRIRAVVLDHGGTPVVAYALEPERQLNVRKDRLRARGWEPGPWLNALKQQLLAGSEEATIELPDGSRESVASLAADLLLITPGKHLVYATDLADSAENRQRLIALAKNAHTFFCEASFMVAEEEHARRNGHLTTRACGEIAMAAGVARLVPFHFSRRYLGEPQPIYEEIQTVCPRVVVPASPRLFEAASEVLEQVPFEAQ